MFKARECPEIRTESGDRLLEKLSFGRDNWTRPRCLLAREALEESALPPASQHGLAIALKNGTVIHARDQDTPCPPSAGEILYFRVVSARTERVVEFFVA